MTGRPGDHPAQGDQVPDASTAAVHPEPLTADLDWRTSLAVVAGVLGLFALLSVAQSARQALVWIVIGTLLALALDPIVLGIENRFRCRREVAVGLVIVAVVGFATGLVFLLGPRVVKQAREFRQDLPKVVSQLEQLPVVGDQIAEANKDGAIDNWLTELPTRLGANDESLGRIAESVLGGALATFATILVMVVLLLDGRRLVLGVRRVIPPSRRPAIERMAAVMYRTVGRYFAGSVLIAILNGTFILVASLGLGSPLAPVAAIWATITNLIPQIGGFLGGSLFVLLALTQGATKGLIALALFLVYQQFENHVLQPTVVGQAVDLSPPATMMAALVGASTAGVPGALVAVPLIGAAKVIYREVRGEDPARRRSGSDEIRPRRRERLLRLLRRGHPTDTMT